MPKGLADSSRSRANCREGLSGVAGKTDTVVTPLPRHEPVVSASADHRSTTCASRRPNGHRPDFEPEATAIRENRGGAEVASRSSLVEPTAAAIHESVSDAGAKIVIVDDCTLFREALATVLIRSGIDDPRLAWDLPSLVAALGQRHERVVVLLSMATRGSDLLLQVAMDIHSDVRVIVLGASEDDELGIVACAEAGVAGYHMRSDTLKDLLTLIQDVADGNLSCSPRVSAILLKRLSNLASHPPSATRELALTTREAQILRMLELGRSNRDIAEQLSIAVHTVKNHVHSLLTKLGVSTRTEAAALSRTIKSTGAVRKN
jgi:DNA-binding NarL/FixJ family response regulator